MGITNIKQFLQSHVALIICLACFCGITAGIIVWQQSIIQTLHFKNQTNSIAPLSPHRRYGEIVAIDAAARTITTRLLSPHSEETLDVELYVSHRTRIQLERAMIENDTIVGVSEAVDIPLSELSIGDAVYVIFTADTAHDRVIAHQVVLGNPFPLINTR